MRSRWISSWPSGGIGRHRFGRQWKRGRWPHAVEISLLLPRPWTDVGGAPFRFLHSLRTSCPSSLPRTLTEQKKGERRAPRSHKMADSKTPEPAAATAASPDPTAAASAAPVSPPAPTSSPPAAQQTDENLLPGAHWTQQPQDDHERDSVYSEDEEPAESTASMSSSVLRYRTIMGRTYHSERGNAQYW